MTEKVLVPLEQSVLAEGIVWPPATAETLWLKQTPDGAELDNIPVYAKGVALGDIIALGDVREGADDDSVRYFGGVVKHSGHGTVRAILTDDVSYEAASTALRAVRERGFEVEMDDNVVAIDIPPGQSISELRSLFLEALNLGGLVFEIGYDPRTT